MGDYTRLPGYTGHHRNGLETFANAFTLTLGMVVLVKIMESLWDAAAAPARRRRAADIEREYRRNYRAKLAEVGTPYQVSRLRDAAWDQECSYDDRAIWNELIRRWCAANPTTYPSQDQYRSYGYLCRCVGTHTCQRGEVVNLSEYDAQLRLRREALTGLATWAQANWRPLLWIAGLVAFFLFVAVFT